MIEENKKQWYKLDFEEQEKIKQDIIKKLDKNIFLGGLIKLTKIEMFVLIGEMLDRIDFEYENFEEDFKDNCWDRKYWLIETLDPEYFSKRKYNEDN